MLKTIPAVAALLAAGVLIVPTVSTASHRASSPAALASAAQPDAPARV